MNLSPPIRVGKRSMLCFHIITLFPDYFEAPLKTGLFKKAIEKGIIKVITYDLRNYSLDKHRKVDDLPFGGGAGMVLMPEPVARAIDHVKENYPDAYVINLSPSGRKFDFRIARELSEKKNICLLCGRYEGIDERIAEHMCDDEISIGDYILHAGETAALVLIDALSRLQEGFMTSPESKHIDSFSEKGLLSFPQYTRPRIFRGWKVPEVLFSGNHEEIRKWKKKQSLLRTFTRRPDLINYEKLDEEERKILQEIKQMMEGKDGHRKGES